MAKSYATYPCFGFTPGTPLTAPPATTPKCEPHAPQPEGYTAWFDWAGRMARAGRRQRKCAGCGLWLIWTPDRLPAGREDVTGG